MGSHISANAGFLVTGSLVKEKTVSPGQNYQVIILIKQTGGKSDRLKIYQNDYFFDYTGKSYYPAPGKLKRSNADWIEIQNNELILNTNEEKSILLDVHVPPNDSLKGTYWSTIMIEGVNEDDANPSGQITIHSRTRYAIQLLSNFADTGSNLLKFHTPKLLNKSTGQKALQVILSNDGDHVLSPALSLELFNSQTGSSSEKKTLSPKELLPGTSRTFEFPLDSIASENQKYIAVIVADGKGENIFGIQYPLEL